MGCGRKTLMTCVIVFGILVIYYHQMSPSPVLLSIGDYYGCTDDALLNLSCSIIFPMLIAGSIVGGSLERRVGTNGLFIMSFALVTIGLLINYIASVYAVFLVGRVVYGLGFGTSIPFIGSAIMKWYTGRQRSLMTTINALFPFVATVLSFMLTMPLFTAVGSSIEISFGIWGWLTLAVLAVWLVFVRNPDAWAQGESPVGQEAVNPSEKGLYIGLLKRRPIVLLCIIFACDFACYAYVATVLPTLLFEASDMTEATANFWAAIAFPVAGMAGCALGGIVANAIGLHKPTLIAGQALKFAGIASACLGADVSVWLIIIGAGLFGVGNGMWMPVCYAIPTELPGMNSSRVAAAFALTSSCAFVMGFLAPTIGGWLTTALANMAPVDATPHVFGLVWSLFAFGFLNLLALVCAVLMPETGPRGSRAKNRPLQDCPPRAEVQDRLDSPAQKTIDTRGNGLTNQW